ncbi:nitrate- and nitrite sensing domain-containing protein [Micromonospora sp. NBC_01699]|uniref:sensor histidine kinase n=1 Tax=Micromonospora sp. NBC_01699 TaxID=2975984 RepID=UPI002E2CAF9A|nr:nitrate- and nitrite sensing domain-containing protein [Micromonospora sp. NBC_01699]
MNSRNWTIRSKIIALVAVPIAALLALWIFATLLTIEPATRLLSAQSLLDKVGKPGTVVVGELQAERRLSIRYLAGGDLAALNEQRAETDRAIAEMRRLTDDSGLLDSGGDQLRGRIDQLFVALEALPAGRGFIDRKDMDRAGAFGLYSSTISLTYRVFDAMAALGVDGVNVESLNVISLGGAREVLDQVDAVLAGAFVAGRFAEGEYPQVVQAIGTQRFLYEDAVADLPDSDRAAYQRMVDGEDFVRVRAMMADVVAKGRTGAAVPVGAEAWRTSYDNVQQQLYDFELAAADTLTDRAKPVAVQVLVRLGLAGLLGLAAVILSMFIAVRVGRSLIGRLTGLRTAALELAGTRLPDVVGRLRRGEDVDVARESPDLEYGRDEIGQVGNAFSEVQRTAVRSAVDEAGLRRGMNEVFLNIARRSQTLLHRQLALLDKMERRVTEPEELEDLFRIDHMATRMRRHAEDLVILAGAAPGRGWRNPVAMVDVMRGAISEVEDYARVDVAAVQPASVVGPAVGDVIHLLAELIENATSFSPPHTRVRVTGQLVPNGYAIEAEDRGLGMTPEALDAANRRLADPPEFDPVNSARLGLFVVAQLGARHGVKVQLRSSPYGGVTAVALIPGELVVPGNGPLALPGRPVEPVRSVDPIEVGELVDADSGPGTGSAPLSGATLASRLGAGPGARAGLAGRTGSGQRIGSGVPERRARTLGRLTAVPSAPDRDVPDRPGGPFAAPATVGTPAGASPPATEPTAVPVGDDGLPRRVRQTSLAPQLREPTVSAEPAPRDAEPSVQPPKPAGRTPEEIRAMMSAMQAGTARGRRDAASPTDAPTVQLATLKPATLSPATAAPRTTVPPEMTPAPAPAPTRATAAGNDEPVVAAPASPADAPVADPGSTDSGRDA